MDSMAAKLVFGAACLVLLTEHPACALDFHNPQNGHIYRLVRFPELSWEQARLASMAETYGASAGYLATIGSLDEQNFITSRFGAAISPWGAWLGGFQPAGSVEPAGNWQWVTGEPFGFTNWVDGEPNNNGDEKYLQLFVNGYLWNDLGDNEAVGSPLYDLPYIVEFNVPEPGSAWLTLMAAYIFGGLPRRGRRGRGLSERAKAARWLSESP